MVHTKTPEANLIFICVLMGPRRSDYSYIPYYPFESRALINKWLFAGRGMSDDTVRSLVGSGQKTGHEAKV